MLFHQKIMNKIRFNHNLNNIKKNLFNKNIKNRKKENNKVTHKVFLNLALIKVLFFRKIKNKK